MKRVRIRIIGKVQGVFFRLYTQKKAVELKLTGWVQNEPDGSVIIEAQGEDNLVEQLIAWCHIGSPWSQVLKVDAKKIEQAKEEEGFKLR